MTLARRIQLMAATPERLLWAVRVRWLVIFGFLLLALAAWRAAVLSSPAPCLWAAAAGALLNAANHVCVRHRRMVIAVTAVAIPLDHLLITYVVANTGAVESPFVMMYFVQVVATAMLVDAWVAVASAGCAVVVWVVGLDLLGGGWLPAARLLQSPASSGGELRVLWGAFLLYCLGLLVYLGGYIGWRLQSSERDLEEKNRRLTAALASLQEAYERLKRAEAHAIQSEKMRALGQLVAGVAHELNNPISFVAANIEHLRHYSSLMAAAVQAGGGRGGEAPAIAAAQPELSRVLADLPALLDDCEEGARRAKEIVDQLRNFSRQEDGSGWRSTDIARDLEATLHVMRHRLGKRITVHKAVGQLPEVECLPGQINQVLMNLIANAADAIGDCTGDIWIEAGVDGARQHLILSVRDNGSGMPPDVCERIFDPFFTTKDVGQGTGLGLTVSYAIVERHRGCIAVRSRPGEGSCFTVTLPLRQRRPAEGESRVDCGKRSG